MNQLIGGGSRLLSDIGPDYIAGEKADWLEYDGMDHVRGAPYHPQTQGRIERCHQTLKNRILLENYFLLGDLEGSIGRFANYYAGSRRTATTQRFHSNVLQHCRHQLFGILLLEFYIRDTYAVLS